MALKIRLTRTGAIHNPHYRVVVAEARSRRDGAAVEYLGSYAPRAKTDQITIKLDRVDYWLSKGAKPTDTTNSLIKKARKAPAAPVAEAPAPAAPVAKATAPVAPAAPVAETPAAVAPVVEAPAADTPSETPSA